MSTSTNNNDADDAISNASSLDSKLQGMYTESWEPAMSSKIASMVSLSTPQRPYMVALVGIPGSGKSTSSLLLAASLEEEHDLRVMIMPHDGYHYPLEYLKTFPDAEDAIYRRGAPDTFDPNALLRDLQRIRSGDEDRILVPAFDHSKGDPTPAKHMYDRHLHDIVLCEGLYLLHQEDGWQEIGSMFDFRIFLNSDVDSCIERVKIRNQCIPGYTVEEIILRCERVDRTNAMTVLNSKERADCIVEAAVSTISPSSFLPHDDTSPEDAPSKPIVSVPSQLQLLAQKDVDEAETNDNADWVMDITSRRSESLAARPRSDSIVSHPSIEPPPPASAFLGSWEPALAERIVERVRSGSHTSPFMVALVGIPGSGKSVSSFLLASILEERGTKTMVFPHDGYHYPLDYLRTFPDGDDYVYRRGAPDTFDPAALLRDLRRVKSGHEELIKLPAFDHAKADPEPDTHIFDRHQHAVVLCEGLYLLHDRDGWSDIGETFDLTIFLNSDLETCIERVKIRNQCIPGYTPEEIEVRCEKVDRVNALTVLQSKARADVIVEAMATARM